MPDFIVLEIKDYKGTNTVLSGKKYIPIFP